MNNLIFLSHILNPNLLAYSNGDRIVISKVKQIFKGDSSNNSNIVLSTHCGTHIDFPYHFNNDGMCGDEYEPNFFIFNKISYIKLNVENILDYKITIEDIHGKNLQEDSELLIIKTGMGDFLENDEYWNSNPCFSPELASYLKIHMPQLRAIGFDSISLTGWKYREIGKLAHREFLIKNNILIIEDMNLKNLKQSGEIKKIIVSPLRFEKADGAPVTVFAYLEREY